MTDLNQIDEETNVIAFFVQNPVLSLNYSFPADVFSSAVNENLFRNIQQISFEEKKIDYLALVSILKSRGLLEVCGGNQYLQFLRSIIIDHELIEVFIRHLIDDYKKRKFLSYIKNFVNVDFPSSKVDSILDGAIDYLGKISLVQEDDYVLTLKDASETAFSNLLENTKNRVIRTSGFEHIDMVTGGLYPGDLWYVAGRPGMGKTAWCINAINKQIESGISTLLISLEMSLNSLIYRLLAVRTGIPILKMKLGAVTQKEISILAEEKDKLAKLPLFIDINFKSDIHYISSIINKYAKRGVQVVHIDYIQLINISDINNSVREYSMISRTLKLLANKLGISVVGYSQLSRNVETRADKRPFAYDLRESGGLEQDADVVIMLYRDDVYNTDTKDKGRLENLIRKQREGETGVLFSKFVGETNKISEEF